MNKIIKIKSIYRSLSRHNFFLQYENNEKLIEKLIPTVGDNFCLAIACSPTIWNPTFEQMKILLILGVNVGIEYSQKERETILKNPDIIVEFGSILNHKVIVNNNDREIYLVEKGI